MIKNMELAQVRRGESFILDGVKFVKLDEDAHASFVLTADVFPKHIPFEHKDAQHEQEIAEQKTCDEGASDAD